MDEIIDTLAEKIAKNILQDPKLKLDPTEPLVSTGVLDSFNLVDLALMVEETWGVRIEDFELNDSVFDNLEELAALIQSRL